MAARRPDADVDGDATLKTTLSAPCSAFNALSRLAVRSSASSQPIRSHPGSPAPLGRVRLRGWTSRSGWYTSSGAARPFAHSARPVGCPRSGSRATKRPSSTTATDPHRETQSAQYPWIRSVSAMPLCRHVGVAVSMVFDQARSPGGR